MIDDLNSIETILRIVLQIGGIVAGLLILFGYVFHIGRKGAVEFKLLQTPKQEFRYSLMLFGGLMFFYFLLLAILAVIFSEIEEWKVDLQSLDGILFIGLFALLLTLVVEEKKEKPGYYKRIPFLLIFIISLISILIWTFIVLPRNGLLFDVVTIAVIITGMFSLTYRKGKEVGIEEFENPTIVDVITDNGDEKGLIMYQTTESDYRFKTEMGDEIIIPRERIKKIVYKASQELDEDNKT